MHLAAELIERIALTAVPWVALCSGIWAVALATEKVLTREAIDSVAEWLFDLDLRRILTNFAKPLSSVLDVVFGKRHLSVRCFGASCCISLVLFFLTTLFYTSFDWHLFTSPAFWMFMFPAALVLNVIPDYLSVLESRLVIGKMQRHRSFLGVSLLLVLDLFLSTLVAIFVGVVPIITVSVFLFSGILVGQDGTHDVEGQMRLIVGWIDSIPWGVLKLEAGPAGVCGIYFYTTFATTFWAWVFVLSAFFVWVAHRTDRFWKWIIKTFNVIDHPIVCIAYFSILLVTIVYLLAIARWLLQ